MRCVLCLLVLFLINTNCSIAQQSEFSLQNQHLNKSQQKISLKQEKPKASIPFSIELFKRMPNHFKTKNKLPVFCELEHQLSKAIKKNVKFGVEP